MKGIGAKQDKAQHTKAGNSTTHNEPRRRLVGIGLGKHDH